MIQWLRDLFSDSSNVSMMRLLSLISLLAAIALAYLGKDGYEVFVISAFGGKVLQKISEMKNGQN